MRNKTQLAALVLAAATIASPFAWAQDSNQAKQNAEPNREQTLSTKALKDKRSDNKEGWINFQEAMKKLDEAGHTNIISLTQTRNGYYARVLDGNDEVQHIIIHPTEGTLSEKDVADLRRNRSDKVYRSHSSRVKKGHSQRGSRHGGAQSGPHHGSHGDHPGYLRGPKGDHPKYQRGPRGDRPEYQRGPRRGGAQDGIHRGPRGERSGQQRGTQQGGPQR